MARNRVFAIAIAKAGHCASSSHRTEGAQFKVFATLPGVESPLPPPPLEGERLAQAEPVNSFEVPEVADGNGPQLLLVVVVMLLVS